MLASAETSAHQSGSICLRGGRGLGKWQASGQMPCVSLSRTCVPLGLAALSSFLCKPQSVIRLCLISVLVASGF